MKKTKRIAGIEITEEILKEILETPEGEVLTPIPYLVFPINGETGMTWGIQKRLTNRIVLFCEVERWDSYEEEWYKIDEFFFEIRPQDFGLKEFF